MSNRFDDMMVQGINTNDATASAFDILQGKTAYANGQKITGTLVPSGGGDDLNIYVQSSVPATPKGVWIKKASASQNTYFTSHFTKQGYFIDDNFSYMNQTTPIYAQCVAGNYLYVFGNSSSESFKYNLRTGEKVGTINVPTFGSSFQGMAVYCAKNNSIYVGRTLTGNNQYFRWFKYDIDTNTSMLYATQFSVYRTDSITSATIYDDYVYFYVNNYIYNHYVCTTYKINIDDDTTTNVGNVTSLLSGSSSFAQGKYIYVKSYNYVYKYDITTTTYEQKTILTSEDIDMYSSGGMIAVSGDKLYIFFYSSSEPFETYLIYDWETDEKTFKSSNIPYLIGTTYNSNILDEADGVVYFHSVNYDTLAFQLSEYNLEDYTSNSPLIVQDLAGQHMTIIDDNSQLTIGVKDAFIIDSSKQLEDYMTCYGDGNKWIVIKNPTGETCTLSYDLDGGTGTFPSQTVVCGTVPIAPSNVPTKSGAIFESWYLGNEPFDFSTPIAVDTTLTAHYLEYEEVEYIQSTGTQYIDTGFKPNQNTNIEVDFEYLKGNNGSVALAGARTDSSSNRLAFLVDATSKLLALNFGTYDSGFVSGTELSTRTTVKNVGCSLYMNGTQVASSTSNSFTSSYSIALFGINNYGTIETRGVGMKLYSAKIYDNGTLVRDFQPIKLSTGEYCLLDEVEHKVYHNAGTGVFIGEGWDNPQLLSYIQSSGTEYIDTDILPTDTFKIDLEVARTDLTQNDGLCGSYTGSQWCDYLYLTNVGKYGCAYGTENVFVVDSTAYNDTNKHHIVLDLDSTNGMRTYVDSNLESTKSFSSIANGLNFYIFKCNDGGTSRKAKVKMYSFKIYKDNTLVRDYLPAKDPSGNICMWDNVTKDFYYNAGTGTFTAGEVVNNG